MQGILILSFRYIWWQEEAYYIVAEKLFYPFIAFIARCEKGCDPKPHRAWGKSMKEELHRLQ